MIHSLNSDFKLLALYRQQSKPLKYHISNNIKHRKAGIPCYRKWNQHTFDFVSSMIAKSLKWGLWLFGTDLKLHHHVVKAVVAATSHKATHMVFT